MEIINTNNKFSKFFNDDILQPVISHLIESGMDQIVSQLFIASEANSIHEVNTNCLQITNLTKINTLTINQKEQIALILDKFLASNLINLNLILDLIILLKTLLQPNNL